MSESKAEAKYRGRAYQMTDKGLMMWKPSSNGVSPYLIANFNAQILRDVVLDDGQQTQRAHQVEATFEKHTNVFTISAREFSLMNWPGEQLGGRAIIFPNCREHVSTAIRMLSKRNNDQVLYRHTGWREIEGHYVYCQAEGRAIGAKGYVKLETQLSSALGNYQLPDPRRQPDIKRAVRASMGILELAPDRVTFPLFAAIWRAIIGKASFSMHLAGHTGTGKSELAALAQQHFGAKMNAKRLPAAWSSTANALEALAFECKDALLTIDDFIPTGNASDIARLNQTADRVLRGQGNQAGRMRMNSEMNLQPSKFSRGLILSTGEDTPTGQSLRARLIIIELAEKIRFAQLEKCQNEAREGRYAMAAAGFIRWLAPRMGNVQQEVQHELTEFRKASAGFATHQRTPDNLCDLAAGFRVWLKFARSTGAINAKTGAALWVRACRAFQDLVEQQESNQASTDPSQQFISILQAALASGRAYLVSHDGGPPYQHPAKWGWSLDNKKWVTKGSACKIGWQRGDDVFLEPTSAFEVVQNLARGTGQPITLQLSTLQRRLKQSGILASTDEARETVTVRIVLENAQRSVLHFTRGGVYPPGKPDKPDISKNTLSILSRLPWSETLDKPDIPDKPDISPDITKAAPIRPKTAAQGQNVGFVRFPRKTPPPSSNGHKKREKPNVGLVSGLSGKLPDCRVLWPESAALILELFPGTRPSIDRFLSMLLEQSQPQIEQRIEDKYLAACIREAFKRAHKKQTSVGLFLDTVPALIAEDDSIVKRSQAEKRRREIARAEAEAKACKRCTHGTGLVIADTAREFGLSTIEVFDAIEEARATFCECENGQNWRTEVDQYRADLADPKSHLSLMRPSEARKRTHG